MKQVLRLTLLSVIALFVATYAFAQIDSTYAPAVSGVLSTLESKFSWVVPALAVVGVLSEVIAALPIKQNSVWEVVVSWAKYISSLGSKKA